MVKLPKTTRKVKTVEKTTTEKGKRDYQRLLMQQRRNVERQRVNYVENAVSELVTKSGLLNKAKSDFQKLKENGNIDAEFNSKPIDVLQHFIIQKYVTSCTSTVLYLTPKTSPEQVNPQLSKAFEFLNDTAFLLIRQTQLPELLNKLKVAEKLSYVNRKYYRYLKEHRTPEVEAVLSESEKAFDDLTLLFPVWLNELISILRGGVNLETSEQYRRYKIILAFNAYFRVTFDSETVKALTDMEAEIKRQHDLDVKVFEKCQTNNSNEDTEKAGSEEVEKE